MLQPVHAGICRTPHRMREHALLQLRAGLPLKPSFSIAADLPRPGTEHSVLSPVSSTSHTNMARRTQGSNVKPAGTFLLMFVSNSSHYKRVEQCEAPLLRLNGNKLRSQLFTQSPSFTSLALMFLLPSSFPSSHSSLSIQVPAAASFQSIPSPLCSESP